MEFLDPKQKRRRSLLLFTGYFLFIVVIIMSTVILVFRASGYDRDQKTGKIIQNGMLFIANEPESSAITINGQKRSERTTARIALPADSYKVDLTRDGYRAWHKTIAIDGGSVEQVRYPRLFPDKMTAKNVTLYASTPLFFTQSIDQHWVAIGKAAAPLEVDVYDSSRDELTAVPLKINAQTVPVDAELGTFKVVEWSTDNQHFLISYHRPSGTEFVWVDREKSENALNINDALGVKPAKVTFKTGDSNQLYIFDNGGAVVRVADLRARTLSAPLTSAAIAGFPQGDTLYYVTADPEKSEKAIVRIHNGDKDYIMAQISSVNVKDPLVVTYNHHIFVLLSSSVGASTLVQMYKDPEAALKDTSKVLPDPIRAATLTSIQNITVSPDKRFILIANKDVQVVFDIELSRQYRFSLPGVQDASTVRWIDDTHLNYVKDGAMNIVEFDSANQQPTVTSFSGQPAYFDKKGAHLLSLAPTADGKVALQSTSIIVKK